jgi:probable rRNA maturation factor
MNTFTISASAKTYPKLRYEDMKNDILGKKYVLSLAFVGATKAQRLNEEHRKKTYVPNVLSFPLTDDVGEIYITPKVARAEAKKFGMTKDGYIGFLFIHALLHLKGMDHGDTMDKAEQKYCLRYNLH